MDGPGGPFIDPPVVVLSYQLVDQLMPRCDPSEWKVICAVIRHRREPAMTVSQLMQWTGLSSRDGCHGALQRCLDKGYLLRSRHGASYHYAPNDGLRLPVLPSNADR